MYLFAQLIPHAFGPSASKEGVSAFVEKDLPVFASA